MASTQQFGFSNITSVSSMDMTSTGAWNLADNMTDTRQELQGFTETRMIVENHTMTSLQTITRLGVFTDPSVLSSLTVLVLLVALNLCGTMYELLLRSRRSGVRASRDIPIGEVTMETELDGGGLHGQRRADEQHPNHESHHPHHIQRHATEPATTSSTDTCIAGSQDNSIFSIVETRFNDQQNLGNCENSSLAPGHREAGVSRHYIKRNQRHRNEHIVSLDSGDSVSPQHVFETDGNSFRQTHHNDHKQNKQQQTLNWDLGAYKNIFSQAQKGQQKYSPIAVSLYNLLFCLDSNREPPTQNNNMAATDISPKDQQQSHLQARYDHHSGHTGPNSSNLSVIRSSRLNQRSQHFHRMEGRLPQMERRHLATKLSMIDLGRAKPFVGDLFRRFLVCFSIRRNLSNVLGKGHADTLFCLNGVRVMSIGWIVLGSYYSALYKHTDLVENNEDLVEMVKSLWLQPVVNTTLAADSFFLLSGTLCSYNFNKQRETTKGQSIWTMYSIKEYLLSVGHRLARIVPCYYLVLLLYTTMADYLMRSVQQHDDDGVTVTGHCKEQWWTNALLISNFYQADHMCMPWTYYLVNDFQMSLLSPLVMILLVSHSVVGFLVIFMLIGLQVASVLLIGSGLGKDALRLTDDPVFFSEVYAKPYCRVAPYVVGLGLGYLLQARDKRLYIRQIPLYLGWTICLTLVISLPYIPYLNTLSTEESRWHGFNPLLFDALSRPLWSLALAWVIFCCSYGQGGFVSKLLSWNFFIPLCRLTYGVYLLHPIVIDFQIYSRQTTVFVSLGSMIYGYIANFVCAFLLSIVLTVGVEQPFVGIEAAVRKHLGSQKSRPH